MRRLHLDLILFMLFGYAACVQSQTGAGSAAAGNSAHGPNGSLKAKVPPAPPPCPAEFNDGLQRSGVVPHDAPGVIPPQPKIAPEAQFSDEARKAIKKQHLRYFDGESILSMIVGVDGIPRDLCLKKSAGYGLDAQAAKAALQYRFEPATKDGEPVPSRTTIEVDFRLF